MIKTNNSEHYKKLIQWLKDGRNSMALTQRELSDRLSEAHTFVQKVESLERGLGVYEYVQYCEALGLDPGEGIKLLESKFNRRLK